MQTIIESSYNVEHGINLPANYVRATTFWLIDNEKFIGEINIRHELNSFLINYGGHIGYCLLYTSDAADDSTEV